ncbi:MAG: amidohydrolase family protein [Acidobacteriaceae bacterium]
MSSAFRYCLRRTAFAFLALLLIAVPLAHAQQRMLVSGWVVTPNGVLPHGWLELENGKIIRMYTAKPTLPALRDVPVLATDDLIFPGFIDLHNHPMFNVFPRWTPPVKYPNRYAWRDSDIYKKLIEQPAAKIFDKGENFCDIDEYVEIKALIGGTTSIIGISEEKPATATQPAQHTPNCVKGLARNLDSYTGLYGTDTNHERIVNSIGILPRDMNANRAAEIARGIHNGSIDLLAIHIAEGLPTDPESQSELDDLDAHHLLTSHTVLIHSVGLSPSQLARVHAAKAAIVWSPRSNFELYGATANVDAAFRDGVSIALAPDWSPTGSDNMLDEIKYASHVSQSKLDGLFSNRELDEMASSVPARIARIGNKVGTLAPGMYADFFLLKGNPANPYNALANASVTDMEMVFVNGVPLYGTPAMMQQLGVKTEALDVCGARRALNSAALPSGSFAAVSQRLSTKMKAAGTELAPLAECVK